MVSHSHAQHRPKIGRDPTDAGSPHTSSGHLYPMHDILAVVGDEAAGEQIAQALSNAGVPEDDFDLLDPQWFLREQQRIRESQGIFRRIASGLSMEEGSYLHEYLDEAAEGHFLIAVHAEDPERTVRVRDVLKAHGARRLRHYKRGTIEEL